MKFFQKTTRSRLETSAFTLVVLIRDKLKGKLYVGRQMKEKWRKCKDAKVFDKQ